MQSVATPKKQLESIKELAARLNMSPRWVWKALASGAFGPQPIRLGRSVKFDPDEIDRWIDAGRPPREQWQVIRKNEMAVRA